MRYSHTINPKKYGISNNVNMSKKYIFSVVFRPKQNLKRQLK